MYQALKTANCLGSAALLISAMTLSACSPAPDVQVEPELELEGNSGEAFEALLEQSESRPDSYSIIATDSGWQFKNGQNDDMYQQPFSESSAKTNDCSAADTPRVSLPANTPIELVFASYQTAETFTEEFRRTCIREWDIDLEYLPGYPIGHNVDTGDARSICAVCDDSGTNAPPLLIEIGSSSE